MANFGKTFSAVVYASMTSLSHQDPDPEGDVPAPDPDLLQFLRTNNGLAHMTAAIVSQHIFLYTSLKLSATEIDNLFLSFEHVTSYEDVCFNTFLCEYEQLFAATDRLHPLDAAAKSKLLDDVACIHGPVIQLLTALLKVSIDPVRYTVLWLRILAMLCRCTKSHIPLLEYRTTAAVLGCMGARHDTSSVQEYGCLVLARVAQHKPAFGEKGAIREGAIQLVVQSMQHHSSFIRVTKNALRFVGNITQTYARLAMDAVNSMEFASLDKQRDALVAVMGMLNFIEETAVPLVRNIRHTEPDDSEVQTHVKRILSYFQDHNDSGYSDDATSPLPTQKSMDAEVTNHFSNTTAISETTANVIKRQSLKLSPGEKPEKKKRSRSSKKKVKFDRESSQPPECLAKSGNAVVNDTDSNHSRVSSVSPRSNTEKGRSRSSTGSSSDSSSVKNGTGMMAFAVRTSHKDKLKVDEREGSRAKSVPPLRRSIMNGVEFFSDDEDEKSRSNSTGSTVSGDKVPSDKENTTLRLQTPKTSFVSQAALDAPYKPPDVKETKKPGIFEKLSRKGSKKTQKKRFSILSTEYNQKTPNQEAAQLQNKDKLYGYIEKPVSKSVDDHSEHIPMVPLSKSCDMDSPRSNESAYNRTTERTPISDIDLGTNVSRYVNIFCNMSKRRKFKDTISIASSEDSGEHKRSKTSTSPQVVADFMKRTRRLFNDGKGKYDIADAVIRASFSEKNQRSSNIPLSLGEHGHDCDLMSVGTFRQELNY